MTWGLFFGCWLVLSIVGTVIFKSAKAARRPDDFYKKKSTGQLVLLLIGELISHALNVAAFAYGLLLIARNWPS